MQSHTDPLLPFVTVSERKKETERGRKGGSGEEARKERGKGGAICLAH